VAQTERATAVAKLAPSHAESNVETTPKSTPKLKALQYASTCSPGKPTEQHVVPVVASAPPP